ncbi:hypothetical protein [Fusobacterium sp.]|uniref:hypothetical protein n=1 Tax=Fusobacterium sp. TaxID=68766 RepID=UPI002605D9DF|nr:hypothetical protein [Fusobacterium sp.]
MTNLINVEKSLKHWLKNKVTVTTATVVGFLIMGTVSFGATIIDKEIATPTVEENKADITIEKNGSIKLNNIIYQGIDAITLKQGGSINNNGNISITGLNDTYGINGILSKGNLKFNNSGKFEIITQGSQAAKAINVENGNAKIHNTGTIKVDSNRPEGGNLCR